MTKNNTLVSIFCPVYNHEKYLHECLKGFVIQKVNFIFEVFVQDDASTDNSQNIINEYAKKYDFIIPIIHKENIYSKGENLNEYFIKHAQGKYLAICEGDDYWTDSNKLQKQVDFLEANNDFSICFHEVNILKEGKILDDYITPKVAEETTIFNLAKGNYIHTPSAIFRRDQKVLDEFLKINSLVGDYVLHMLNAKNGKIKKINKVMAIYRVHSGGLHSLKSDAQKNEEWLTMLDLIISHFQKDVQIKLAESYVLLSKYVLLQNNISKQRRNEIIKKLNKFCPELIIQLLKEIEQLKHKVSATNRKRKGLFRMLKRILHSFLSLKKTI